MIMKSLLPWWSKICLKLILSRLPISYGFWRKIGLFRHGHMDQHKYATKIFYSHLQRADRENNLSESVLLELGPGDTVASAFISKVLGAEAILVDSGDYASKELSHYYELSSYFSAKGHSAPDITKVKSLAGLLAVCNAQYLTNGLNSLKTIEDNKVDLIFSQAVLEHIRRHEFLETMKECRRIIKPDGIASHTVDLKDHLGGGLNNLRFSEGVWESDFFARSGFYTNRIRYSEMISLMQEAGFDVDVVRFHKWDKVPIERQKLHPSFVHSSEEDLLVSGFDVLLRPTNNV